MPGGTKPKRWRIAVGAPSILVVLLVSLVSCDYPTAQKVLGIEKTADSFAVHYLLCPGSHVQRVRAIVPSGEDRYDGDDLLVWEIRANYSTATTRFEFGVTPDGFEETFPVRDVFTRRTSCCCGFNAD